MTKAKSLLRPWLGSQARRIVCARWKGGGGVNPTPSLRVSPHGSAEEPVDVVITWVDGNDPEWVRKRTERLKSSRNLSPDATAVSRFENHDELRYLLRAIEVCLPWTRNVILVTSGQRPPWIRPAPGLRLVDHKDFFRNSSDLPTFNSHAIESQLWRIEGLSDRWIYLNDDVIPLQLMRRERFFDPLDRPVVQLGSDVRRIYSRSTDLALDAVDQIVHSRFGVHADRKIAHVPHAQNQLVWRELGSQVGDGLAHVASNPFRTRSDIAPIALHHWWALANNEAIEGDFRPQYVEISEPGSSRTVVNATRDPLVDIICVNQEGPATNTRSGRRAARAVAALNRRFPRPSRFESGRS